MSFGISYATAVFQELMNIVLQGCENFATVVLDNVLLFSITHRRTFKACSRNILQNSPTWSEIKIKKRSSCLTGNRVFRVCVQSCSRILFIRYGLFFSFINNFLCPYMYLARDVRLTHRPTSALHSSVLFFTLPTMFTIWSICLFNFYTLGHVFWYYFLLIKFYIFIV